MRTVTFKSVWRQVVRRCGLDPDDTGMTAARKELFADLITARCRRGWEYAYWPELSTVQERTPDSDDVVEWNQSGEDALGEVESVWNKDPDRYPGEAKQFLFTPTDNGIQIANIETPGSTVWVKFRRLPPRFTMVEGEDGAEYSDGTVLYYSGDGECYQVVDDAFNKLDFPYILERCVVQGAYADYLRQDNQRELAAGEDALASSLLEEAYIVAFKQQAGVQ